MKFYCHTIFNLILEIYASSGQNTKQSIVFKINILKFSQIIATHDYVPRIEVFANQENIHISVNASFTFIFLIMDCQYYFLCPSGKKLIKSIYSIWHKDVQ